MKQEISTYQDFLARKIMRFTDVGFDVADNELNAHLFNFQRHIVKIALRKGRFAIFADCGLGKTLMQLEWAVDVVEQCKAAGVPVFVKQIEVNGKVTGDIEQFPVELQIREFPEVLA